MLLFINTAKKKTFVGLADENKWIVKKIWQADFRQSEELLPEIEKIVDKVKLDGIVVITGPGSYTGLRVGVAVVNALAYGLGVLVMGIDRFEAQNSKLKMQNQNLKRKTFCVVLENIHDLVYAEMKVKSKKEKVKNYFVGTIKELCDKIKEPCYFIGEIDEIKENKLKQILGDKFLGAVKKSDFNDDVLENLREIAFEKIETVDKNKVILPLYIRPAKITYNSGLRGYGRMMRTN